MLCVISFSARGIIRRLAVPPGPFIHLGTGCLVLVLLLTAELSFVLWLRGLSLKAYLAERDSVSGTVYLMMLLLFAVAPVFVAERSDYA